MLFHDLTVTSQQVAAARGRADKARLLAGQLRRAEPGEVATIIGLLSGTPRQGRLGLGPAIVDSAMPRTAAAEPMATVAEVDAALDRIARTQGRGSGADRTRLLTALMSRMTHDEQGFLSGTLLGELRQGALEGLMIDAVAQAAQVPPAEIRHALMVSGDLGDVAARALTEGSGALQDLAIRLFSPVKPMLAQTAEDTAAALARLGKAAFEYKLDGVRIQAHKEGIEVRIYSRRLNPVTAAVPEIVEAVRRLPVRSAILDGEALAFRNDGLPQPFQVTMRRFGRASAVEEFRKSLPLRPFFFDCLYITRRSILDRSTAERFAELRAALPTEFVIPRRVSETLGEADAFLQEALARGHEGIMAKALDAPYNAGARGSVWLKIKPVITFDLVVLAAEWGHGRRRGRLSNLHLGARDPGTGGFVTLGKTFKGMTDNMLAWQTDTLKNLTIASDADTVYVRPELVVEIAFNDIQATPHYPAGLALRFARVRRYRPEKRP